MSDLQAWLALLTLGAFHGVNPGMGWLFAVALGLQERKRSAVFRALVPIAIGHALSIGAIVLLVGLIQHAVPLEWLRWPVGAGLIGFGVYKLIRMRHPKWVGMQVNFRDLVTWSFLMATAHGAGLMLVPVLLGWSAGEGGEHLDHLDHFAGDEVPDTPVVILHGEHGEHEHAGGGHAGHGSMLAAVGKGPLLALLATGVHTLGYLVFMLMCAVVVYEWVGLAILRKAWLNLDGVWAGALILTGVATMVL
jgi:hypothetical protein